MHLDEDAIHGILAAYGWVAEYELANPDDEPARFTYGRTSEGYRYRGDAILILQYGQMALSKHPTLDLSVLGVADRISSVDLVTTPVEEIPIKIAQFACANLTDLVARAAVALRCAHTLPCEASKPASIEETDDLDSETSDGGAA